MFRKFEEAAPDHPEANLATKWIGELYAIDLEAEGDLEKKAELRRSRSNEVLATMKTWLWNQAALKTLSIGNAAAYTIANWDRLTRFVNDPRIPLDNNATERAIRGPVVGRKNHYGSKSRRGTEVASIFYTLLETAKLVGVDPAKYLRAAALADARGETLLPHDFAAEPPAPASENPNTAETGHRETKHIVRRGKRGHRACDPSVAGPLRVAGYFMAPVHHCPDSRGTARGVHPTPLRRTALLRKGHFPALGRCSAGSVVTREPRRRHRPPARAPRRERADRAS